MKFLSIKKLEIKIGDKKINLGLEFNFPTSKDHLRHQKYLGRGWGSPTRGHFPRAEAQLIT